jgi:hypothetical protein
MVCGYSDGFFVFVHSLGDVRHYDMVLGRTLEFGQIFRHKKPKIVISFTQIQKRNLKVTVI